MTENNKMPEVQDANNNGTNLDEATKILRNSITIEPKVLEMYLDTFNKEKEKINKSTREKLQNFLKEILDRRLEEGIYVDNVEILDVFAKSKLYYQVDWEQCKQKLTDAKKSSTPDVSDKVIYKLSKKGNQFYWTADFGKWNADTAPKFSFNSLQDITEHEISDSLIKKVDSKIKSVEVKTQKTVTAKKQETVIKATTVAQTSPEVQKTQMKELQYNLDRILATGKLKPKDLKQLITFYNIEKSGLTQESDKVIKEFLSRNTRTMMEGRGYPVGLYLESDLKLLEVLGIDTAGIREIIKRIKYDPKIDGERFIGTAQDAKSGDNRLFLRRDGEGTFYRTSNIDLVTKDLKLEYKPQSKGKEEDISKADLVSPKAKLKKAGKKQKVSETKTKDDTEAVTPKKESKKARKKADIEKIEGTAATSKVKNNLNIRDENGVIIGKTPKGSNLELNGDTKIINGKEYVGIKLDEEKTGFVAKEFIKIRKKMDGTPAEKVEPKVDVLAQLKTKLEESINSATLLEKDIKKDEKELQDAHNELKSSIEKGNTVKNKSDATMEEINEAQQGIEKATKKYGEILDTMNKRVQEELDKKATSEKTQSKKDNLLKELSGISKKDCEAIGLGDAFFGLDKGIELDGKPVYLDYDGTINGRISVDNNAKYVIALDNKEKTAITGENAYGTMKSAWETIKSIREKELAQWKKEQEEEEKNRRMY